MEGSVQLWDVASSKRVLTYRGHQKGVNGVPWSPDGARLASGSSDVTIQIWRPETGARLAICVALPKTDSPRTGVEALAWSPDGLHLAGV
jgi:WD40 repeat protein